MNFFRPLACLLLLGLSPSALGTIVINSRDKAPKSSFLMCTSTDLTKRARSELQTKKLLHLFSERKVDADYLIEQIRQIHNRQTGARAK